jgi:hypothetical protein|tara:strand:+ start:92 stop:280 length:189 start_codon:yes stop_codon:yes gene_type:complete
MKKKKKKSKWEAEFLDLCIDISKDIDPKNRMHNNDWVRALKKLIPYQSLIKETNKQNKIENN